MTAVPPSRIGAPPVKREAALVRDMIADGTLKPGDLAPSAPKLAREAGCHADTAKNALRLLAADGTLARGVSKTSRLRVAQPGTERDREMQKLIDAPPRALRDLRRARGLTQPALAGLLGVSAKTAGNAERGRLRQSREFWRRADALLGGDLLRLHGTCQAARAGAAPETPCRAALPAVTVTPGSVLIAWLDGTETLARPPGCRGRPQAGE